MMNATDEDIQESKLEEGLMEESSRRRIYRRRRNRREEAKEVEADEESKHAESKEEEDLDGVIPRDHQVQVEESKDRDTPRDDNIILSPVRASRNTSEISTATSVDSKDTTFSPMLRPRSSSIHSKPEDKLKARFSQRLRRATDIIPEVHFIGEISEGVGFNGKFVSCKWYIEWGKSWSLLEGEDSSQTQYTSSGVWNHPIDIHYASTSMLEWPRFIAQIWILDSFGRSTLAGYGYSHLPTQPGDHEMEIHCWKPTNGTLREKLEELFLSKTPSPLSDEDIIFGKAWDERSRLTTISTGKIKLNVNVVLRCFDR